MIGIVAANNAGTYSVKFTDVPGLGSGTYSWTEFYTGQTGTGASVSFTLALHDMAVVKVVKGSVASSSTSSATTTSKPTSTSSTVATTTTTSSGSVAEWGQCGGEQWTGATQVSRVLDTRIYGGRDC